MKTTVLDLLLEPDRRLPMRGMHTTKYSDYTANKKDSWR